LVVEPDALELLLIKLLGLSEEHGEEDALPKLLGLPTAERVGATLTLPEDTSEELRDCVLLDETVTVGSNTATVVEWDSANNYLYTTLPQPRPFANTASISGGGSGASATISAISNPGIQPYSGDVLYVENRSPIQRASDQIEDVKLIIEF
jgi:hypothetical protein